MDNQVPWNNVASLKAEMEPANYSLNWSNYQVQNYKTSGDKARSTGVAINNPLVIANDGYGWIGFDGALVEEDTKVRIVPDGMTHTKGRHPLDNRMNETGYKGRGPLAVDTESILKTGNFLPDNRLNQTYMSVDFTEFRMNYLPPENNPQQEVHIIPAPIQMGGWVRGGMDTRMEMRRQARVAAAK